MTIRLPVINAGTHRLLAPRDVSVYRSGSRYRSSRPASVGKQIPFTESGAIRPRCRRRGAHVRAVLRTPYQRLEPASHCRRCIRGRRFGVTSRDHQSLAPRGRHRAKVCQARPRWQGEGHRPTSPFLGSRGKCWQRGRNAHPRRIHAVGCDSPPGSWMASMPRGGQLKPVRQTCGESHTTNACGEPSPAWSDFKGCVPHQICLGIGAACNPCPRLLYSSPLGSKKEARIASCERTYVASHSVHI